MVVLTLLIALLIVLVTIGSYENDHDIPNPFWGVFNGSYSYTPEQGPPSPELMVTRPETIISRYLDDYIQLAGTFPCVSNPNKYDSSEDPVFEGRSCAISRPVMSHQVLQVYVTRHGLAGEPEAIVDDVIRYADGTRLDKQFHIGPSRYSRYWIAFTHLDCWSSIYTLRLFGRVVSDIPSGAEYGPPKGPYQCQS